MLLVVLPRRDVPICLKVTYALNFNTVIFARQTMFFTPVNRTGVTRGGANTTVTLNDFVNCTPTVFYFDLCNCVLSLGPKVVNCGVIFNVVTYFTFYNTIISMVLIGHVDRHGGRVLTTRTWLVTKYTWSNRQGPCRP